MYGNGGSGNHGCEAIVRGTQEIIKGDFIIQSNSVEEDTKYGLEGEIKPAIDGKISKIRFFQALLKLKISGDYLAMDCVPYLSAIKSISGKAKVAFSVGGDNYCYEGAGFYAYLNQAYRKNGFKTVLWGCSVEPDVVVKDSVSKDLRNYSLIVARESITFDAIKKVNPNTVLVPDPAFFMQPLGCELPPVFNERKVIGINASPMIISYEENQGMAYENYKKLISYILDKTDYAIALIPHVVWESNDDREVLKKLYNDFNQDERIAVIEDHKAPELKYIISKCECFVGARTHATIAAYSTYVPTLVVGYSVKALGIARDLFGTEENYVLPVQSLKSEEQLTEGFKWLEDNKTSIRSRLTDYLPEYKEKMKKAVETVGNL